MSKYLVQFIKTDFKKMFYATLKGDFFPICHIEHATRFDSEQAAVNAGDEILHRGISATGFRGYKIIKEEAVCE